MASAVLRLQTPFALGDVDVAPSRNVLRRGDVEHRVEPRVMDVLCALAARAGEVVERDVLIEELWGVEFGADESLTRAVSRLRHAIRAVGAANDLLETVPKRGYRLTMAITADPPPRAAATAGPVIAVLPFDNQSVDPADAYLGDAVADEILSALAAHERLSMIAGSSSFRLRGERKSLDIVTSALSVSHVVDGAVRRTPAGVRVSVYLVEAATGVVVWSSVEERPQSELFGVRESVAAAVAGALAGEDGAHGQGRRPDPAAYETYLQAVALIRDGSLDAAQRAIAYLSDVTAADPDFAEAWAAQAMARLNMFLSLGVDPKGSLEAAEHAAKRACALAPTLLQARMAETIVDYRLDRVAYAESEARFARLRAEAPGDATAAHRLGLMLLVLGRWRDALAHLRRANELDPLSATTAIGYAHAEYVSGDRAKANELVEAAFRTWGYADINLWAQRFSLYIDAGDISSALRQWEEHRWRSAQPHDVAVGETIDAWTAAHRKARDLGRDPTREEIGAALASVRKRSEPHPPLLFMLLAHAGLNDDAFALAMARIAAGDRVFRHILFYPHVRGLRSEERVMELFAANGLAQYWLETGAWPDFCADEPLGYDHRAAAEEAVRRRGRTPS